MNTKTQPAVVGSSAELGPLPEPVATIGNDGHPRHIWHVWGVGETRLYGPPRGLYRADQVRAYAAAAVAAERERCARMPLTRQQIDAVMTEHYPLDSLLRENVDSFEACVRDIERLLGIGTNTEAKGPRSGPA